MVHPRRVNRAGATTNGRQSVADGTAVAGARERAEQLVREVTDLYGAALQRVMEFAGAANPDLADRYAADDLVASLLLVHGLALRWRRVLVRQGFLVVWLETALLAVDGGDSRWASLPPEARAAVLMASREQPAEEAPDAPEEIMDAAAEEIAGPEGDREPD